MQYYVKATEAEAQAGVDAINNSGWFPVVGNVKGVPAPNKQMTVAWCDAPQQILSGEWAWPRVPESKLNFLGVPQSERDAYLAAFGGDIRELTSADFPQPEPEE